MRDILKEEKLHLKTNEVIHLEVPSYAELSVKNMFPDVLTDAVLAKYLPTPEQLSNRLPERDFFFGVLSTHRRQYMADVISEAHSKRYKLQEGDRFKKGIVLSEAWSKELLKHPYLSSNPPKQLILQGSLGQEYF